MQAKRLRQHQYLIRPSGAYAVSSQSDRCNHCRSFRCRLPAITRHREGGFFTLIKCFEPTAPIGIVAATINAFVTR
jgi:hypothetical protein